MSKIAWIGTPGSDGGVGGVCRLLLRELAKISLDLDVYSTTPIEKVHELDVVFRESGQRCFSFSHTWDWNAWYGRNRKVAFIVSFLKRMPLHGRIVEAVIAEHRREPYDAIIQFSQGELFHFRRYLNEIPIILFPCVHSAGELEWCRRERSIAQRCEPFWWRVVRNQYLAYRSRVQKRDYNSARGVIGMSGRFNRKVEKDYGVKPERLGVVYHPIDESGLDPRPLPPLRPIRLLFVGRVSVRKGIDLLVQIIPKLLAAHPDVEVTIIGAGSLWSDYEPLLEDLPSERCVWLKALPNEEVNDQMQQSDILLVPSLYEPGGIVVGEALANGMMIVASDEVGSAENLPPGICHEFRSGDAREFQIAAELAIEKVRKNGIEVRKKAIQAARAHFDPRAMALLLLSEVSRLISTESEHSDVAAGGGARAQAGVL